MRLISWNVNGIRAAMGKGFLEFAQEQQPDILCVQETKMQAGQAEVPLPGYHQYWCSAEKKGYSGTAVFSKEEPASVEYGIGVGEHDLAVPHALDDGDRLEFADFFGDRVKLDLDHGLGHEFGF